MKNLKIILFLVVFMFMSHVSFTSFVYAEDMPEPVQEAVEEESEEIEDEEIPDEETDDDEVVEEEPADNESLPAGEAGSGEVIEQTEFNFDITLADSCEIQDLGGNMHIFPAEGSPSEYLGVCILAIAKEEGKITSFGLQDSDFGLYVQSLNDINPSATEYWALWVNASFAECGIECLVIEDGDVLSLILSDWMANTESVKINFNVTLEVEEVVEEVTEEQEEEIVEESEETEDEEEVEEEVTEEEDLSADEAEDISAPVSSGGGSIPTPVFSVPNAIAYLESVQDEAGSFGNSDLYTDWASIGLSANGINQNTKTKVLNYMQNNNSVSSLLTDNQRRALAILALGENPYSFFGVDYIAPIVASFDGTQLGDVNLDNDDIFGLLVLSEVGYTINDEIISKTIDFILSAQNTDGSWDSSIDMTSASIQALKPFASYVGVSNALSKASLYLQNNQNTDGGFTNASSTSWALQAGALLGVSFTKNGKTGLDYLASLQTSDGSLLQNDTLVNKIWATSYAIPGVLGKSWADIMQDVSKPQVVSSDGGANNTVLNTEIKKEDIVIEEKKEIIQEEIIQEKIMQAEILGESIEDKEEIIKKDNTKIIAPIIQNKKVAIVEPEKEIPVDAEVLIDTEISSNLQANASSADTSTHTPYILGGFSVLVLLSVYIKKFI